MSEILDRLNQDEYSVINMINSSGGTMEDLDRRLIGLGIPQEYNNIYIGYSKYYKESGDIEALKRMIFIQWYGASEPLTFTGIGMLDEKLTDESLKLLPSVLLDDRVDAEFNIMMLHYYSIAHWYFDSHFDLQIGLVLNQSSTM